MRMSLSECWVQVTFPISERSAIFDVFTWGIEGAVHTVLEMCQEAGLVKLGIVSLDGTKVKGNASIDKNRTYEPLLK